MITEIPFTKMSGTGNDFILIDNRKKILHHVSLKSFARQVCFRQRGVGADGLILLEKSEDNNFAMRIFNADGSEAEMCGNGARCIAQFSRDKRIVKSRKIVFDTLAGTIEASFTDRGVKISLGRPKGFREEFTAKGLRDSFSFVNTGVPHVVAFYSGVGALDVVRVGRKIRYHEEFAPAGANANFVQIANRNSIVVRTYERGVENETLACGTGAAAAAVVGIILGKLASPVKVVTTGREALYIHYEHTPGFDNPVYLEGKVVTTFEGRIRYNNA